MISSKISRRYAKALFGIGREDGNYEAYGKCLEEFSRFCNENETFYRVISSKIFSTEERKNVLEAVLAKSDFPDVVKNFLRVLLDKDRIAAIADITDYYRKLTDEVSNITRARIITARPLKEDALEKLKQGLERLTGKMVIPQVSEDGSLIGGVVVQIGDMVLDGSVKAQLEGLKESLKRGEYN
ncbi:MAG: F0F1 ATP synthase subunit delta [Deltaproteobacteria bacterium]|nr:F0F1 ATP synthase subunit delta [Deltaproteobacteria bacterium]MBW1928780.1 F0F1 ATP synthase subunit delta [Deltaproteobacteria bacterium]MBW2024658.1 F0F1 ATP synthase subunit delta [Deltaproteobacteria bacterium]MBW2124669.1 F0F1 ATP synthase subunit delta [Deltaproteobacteria bacterium]